MKAKDILLQESKYENAIKFSLQKDNYIAVHRNPFGNCQIFSIAWFYYLIRDCSFNEEILLFIKEMFKKVGYKPLLMIDISKDIESNVDTLFKDNTVLLKNEYTSTTGNIMIQYLIKLNY